MHSWHFVVTDGHLWFACAWLSSTGHAFLIQQELGGVDTNCAASSIAGNEGMLTNRTASSHVHIMSYKLYDGNLQFIAHSR